MFILWLFLLWLFLLWYHFYSKFNLYTFRAFYCRLQWLRVMTLSFSMYWPFFYFFFSLFFNILELVLLLKLFSLVLRFNISFYLSLVNTNMRHISNGDLDDLLIGPIKNLCFCGLNNLLSQMFRHLFIGDGLYLNWLY